jgi:hypothetical protein
MTTYSEMYRAVVDAYGEAYVASASNEQVELLYEDIMAAEDHQSKEA